MTIFKLSDYRPKGIDKITFNNIEYNSSSQNRIYNILLQIKPRM